MSNRASLGHVINQLQEFGLIEADAVDSETFSQDNETPWYVEGLIGFGGWIAAIFLLGSIFSCFFLTLSDMDEQTIGGMLLVIGSVFVGGTIFITAQKRGNLGVFVSQLVLTVHIAGQIALTSGLLLAFELWQSDHEIVVVLVFTIIMQIVSIALYQNVIYRFLAMLVISGALATIVIIYEVPIMLGVIAIGLLAISAIIWLDILPTSWQIYRSKLLYPVGYGTIFGAGSLLIYQVSDSYWLWDLQNPLRLTGVLALLCLLSVELKLMRDYDIAPLSRFGVIVLVFSIVLGVIVIETPGILAGLVIILLAFRRRNLILQGLGFAFLAGFIVDYYYWLDVTLLMKSIILMSTGLLLIAGRFGLRRMIQMPQVAEGDAQ